MEDEEEGEWIEIKGGRSGEGGARGGEMGGERKEAGRGRGRSLRLATLID